MSTDERITHIKQVISRRYRIPLYQIDGPSRRMEYVHARHIAMYICKLYGRTSLKTIGDAFGGRDHSTVVHAVRCVEDRIGIDADFSREMDTLRMRIAMDLSPIQLAATA